MSACRLFHPHARHSDSWVEKMLAAGHPRAFGRAMHSARTLLRRRCLHQTRARLAITNLEMPAMSPTMTEGGIASWKKNEGDPFSAGDVLLEIETDKATIDVEAQDDGVLAKILTPNGAKNVPVGKIIALLAEEGDDISNLEAPKERTKPSPDTDAPTTSAPEPPRAASQQPGSVQEKKEVHHPTHSKPLLPSVLRLLVENNITNAEVIKGTGVRGQLTKGDVLAHLGKASSPTGTYKEPKQEPVVSQKVEPPKPLDGAAIRQLIVSGLSTRMKPKAPVPSIPLTFDSVIADYLPPTTEAVKSSSSLQSQTASPRSSRAAYFDGLL
ncbi:single hybrid motif-containing protein [Pisolithus orientalis]|uniref:single hybrid motif-containing protein n=1 Tax=Pisolithus orientalis TaxID=936130 RepID=UPI00222537B4|nr:single hybrid motif-containing protein [Pisolithus orientalis]KAI6019599.1 single hybrid motif-containing protein [Pisolithus orientalis]